MANMVMNFTKLKTGTDMAHMGAHNSREKIMDESGGLRPRPDYLAADEPWPPEWCQDFKRIELNEGQMGKQSDSIGRRWNRAVIEANIDRNPQKNAARAIEGVFTATKGAFQNDDQWKVYLRECREWAERKFGKENILQWNTHYDETTPHLHMILAPIVRGPDGNKYSSGKFLGGPAGLKALHTSLYEEVGKKYGLQRGIEGSKKKHTNQSEWKSELVNKEMELEEREQAVANNATAAAKDIIKNANREAEEMRVTALVPVEEKVKGLDKREKEIAWREGDLEKRIEMQRKREEKYEDGLESRFEKGKFLINEEGLPEPGFVEMASSYKTKIINFIYGIADRLIETAKQLNIQKKDQENRDKELDQKKRNIEIGMQTQLDRLEGKYGELNEFEEYKRHRVTTNTATAGRSGSKL